MKFKQPIEPGDVGSDVKAEKRALWKALGHLAPEHRKPMTDDGEQGIRAVENLKAFQTLHKLKADGVYGPTTHAKLDRWYDAWGRVLYRKAKIRPKIEHWAVLAPGADRRGVKTHQYVIDFIGKAAQIYGHPVVIGTGTNHRQYTTSGHQSKHWTGDAGDVPLVGSALTRFGQACLVAAGMSKARARLCRGGIYNIGNGQIIFNTTAGGNHWNHAHVDPP